MRVRKSLKYKKSLRKKYNGRICYKECYTFLAQKHDTLKKEEIYKKTKDIDKEEFQECYLNSWKSRLLWNW